MYHFSYIIATDCDPSDKEYAPQKVADLIEACWPNQFHQQDTSTWYSKEDSAEPLLFQNEYMGIISRMFPDLRFQISQISTDPIHKLTRRRYMNGQEITMTANYGNIMDLNPTASTYLIFIDPDFIRNAELCKTDGMSDEEFQERVPVSDTDCQWIDIEPYHFVGIINARNEQEATAIAAKKYRYDERILYAELI